MNTSTIAIIGSIIAGWVIMNWLSKCADRPAKESHDSLVLVNSKVLIILMAVVSITFLGLTIGSILVGNPSEIWWVTLIFAAFS